MKTQTEPNRKQSECMENWFLCSTTAAVSASILEKLTATEVREIEKDCFFVFMSADTTAFSSEKLYNFIIETDLKCYLTETDP